MDGNLRVLLVLAKPSAIERCLAEAKALALLCVSACPQNSPVGNNHTPARLFSTRKTRNFRNYRPAHFDSTDHRFAMGGCYGTCVRLLPFSIPPQAVGPLCPPLHRRCKTLNSLRLCVPPPKLGVLNPVLSMPSFSPELAICLFRVLLPRRGGRVIGQV